MTRVHRLGLAVTAIALAIVAPVGKAAAQPAFAYVPNAGDGTVSAIELKTDRVAWTLKVGERAAHGIAASPDGTIVYAGDAAAQEVVVIDARRQTVIKRISVPFHIHGIDIAPDGKTVWAGGQADNDPVRGTLAVINTTDHEIEDVVSPTLGAASHFSFTPDSKEVWIASTSTNLVWIVDVDTRLIAAAVPLTLPASKQRPAPGDDWGAYLSERKLIGLNEIAVSPDGRTAYAVGPAVSELFAIDVKSRRVVKSAHAGERAHGVTVSPDGKEVWIADWAGMVSIFDAATLAPRSRIPMASGGGEGVPGANHIAFAPDGTRVYVTSGNSVVVIDAGTQKIVDRVEVGKEPHEISLEDVVMPAQRRQGASNTSPRTASAVGSSSTEDLKRTSTARSVTVEVTPVNLFDGGDMLEFRIVLDTHAVELDYDLSKIAVLRDDKGNEFRPATWKGPTGGHHVSGVLSFPERQKITDSGAKYLELQISGVGGVPTRQFRWTLEETG